MSTPWIVALLLQMAVTAVLAVIVLALVRQFGVLALRLNPSAGMQSEDGPGPGTPLRAQDVPLLNGEVFQFGGARERDLLVVFLSPDCTICNVVAAHVKRISRDYGGSMDMLVVITAVPRVAREYVRDYGFDELSVALRQNFPNNHGITTTPFALGVTAEGIAAARGVPNALENLEEIIERTRAFDLEPAGVPAASSRPNGDMPEPIEVTTYGSAPAEPERESDGGNC